jgi:hypothetical protein
MVTIPATIGKNIVQLSVDRKSTDASVGNNRLVYDFSSIRFVKK